MKAPDHHTLPATGRQVEPDHYQGLQYDSKLRFISYWHQISAVLRYAPKRVLEVGIGNGFVSRYLREKGIHLETLDLDPDLGPSVAASADALPFADDTFDLVLCCEVLEHLPFARASRALEEFRRVARRNVVVSVPDVTPCIRLIVPVPAFGELNLVLRSFWRRSPRCVSAVDEHWWELGMRGFPPRRFRETLALAGFGLLREYRVFEHPFHHFFELEV